MDTLHVLNPQDLVPGDVLLHMGRGELSRLIAWVGDSSYSHAAVVFDDTRLIEAAASGVRHAPLAQRATMVADFHYIDVFRPSRLQQPDGATMPGLLRDALVPYLGRPYPMTSLFVLGVVCAVRNKIPGSRDLRRVIRMALDLVVENDPGKVVCSELVYRGFDEAATAPRHALRLPIVTRSRQHTPVPDIDVLALAHECLDDLRRADRKPSIASEIALLAAPMHGMHDVAAAAMADVPDDADLERCLQQARAQLGIDTPAHARFQANAAAASFYPAPNPKTVLPADLEFSSGLMKVGRMAMASA
ncbi:hypothetical protein ACXU4B_01690 [Dyella soli]|uniref:Lipo-like protein n=1 Tax=Dyella soli TaxID=522319 RepID=A0A4R0YSI5_9GAMM|nr:hypothetical protein [Dyella soli]TCI09783.1 hypothetical protein EZM97_12555 [Dyella soli]